MTVMVFLFFVFVPLCHLFLSIKYPYWAMLGCVFFLLAWPNYIVYKPAEWMPGITPDRIMLITMIFRSALLFGMSSHRLSVQKTCKPFSFVVFLISCLILTGLLSFFFSEDDKLITLFATVNQTVNGPILFFLLLLFMNSEQRRDHLFNLILTIAIVCNIVGVVEWVHQGALFKESIITETDFTVVKEKVRFDQYRLMSVFANSLVYAQFLVAVLPICFFSIFKSRTLIGKLLFSVNFGLSIFLAYQTYSRAALGLMGCFFVFYFLIKLYFGIAGKLLRNLVVVVIIALSVALVGWLFVNYHDFVESELVNTNEETTQSSRARSLQFQIGKELVAERPILGYGAGNGSKSLAPLKSVDNYYLSLALDYGLTGLALFILLNITLVRFSIKNKIDNYGQFAFVSICLMLAFYLILSIDKLMSLYYVLAVLFLTAAKARTYPSYEIKDIGNVRDGHD